MGGSAAVVLVDPVSSGRYLKEYVKAAGYALIAVFALGERELKRGAKDQPLAEKLSYCDEVIESRDLAEITARVRGLPYEVVAVIPASEPGVELAEALAEELGLRGNRRSSTPARRDKYQMRCAVRSAGLPGPDFAACQTAAQAQEFAARVGLPIMLKTPKGAGAHNVFACREFTQIAEAFDHIVSEPDILGNEAGCALAEEYLEGPQYAIDLFATGDSVGFVGMWQLGFAGSQFQGAAFDTLLSITDPVELAARAHLVDYALAVARAVDVKWGPCLVELRDDPRRGPSLIEVAARLSGIDMPVLTREISDFDPYAATLAVYTQPAGVAVPEVHFHADGAIAFCSAGAAPNSEGSGPGAVRVGAIRGLAEIAALPSHLASHLHVHIGQQIESSGDLGTIPLYVYLANSDRAQLLADVASAHELFGLDFERLAI